MHGGTYARLQRPESLKRTLGLCRKRKIVTEWAGLGRDQRLAAAFDHVRFRRRFDIPVLVEEVRTKQSPRAFIEQHAGIPSVRKVRRPKKSAAMRSCLNR